MEVLYSKKFIRLYDALPISLKREVKEKITLFSDAKNHRLLDVHKLTGRLKEVHSFRIDYKHRVTFMYSDSKPRSAILIAVGDHEIYDR